MIHKQSQISRTPSPEFGGARCHRGRKIQSRHHLDPRESFDPKLKYETLEISEVRGRFERKVLMHCNYIGPLWKQGIYTLQLLLGAPLKAKLPAYSLQLLLGPFESKVFYTLQLQRGARGKCLARLPLRTPLYITLTMILYENMKPIEHVLLPIFVLSHLMCACKHCNIKLPLYRVTQKDVYPWKFQLWLWLKSYLFQITTTHYSVYGRPFTRVSTILSIFSQFMAFPRCVPNGHHFVASKPALVWQSC